MTVPSSTFAARLLERYDRPTLMRGRVYVDEGRVEERERSATRVRATVHGRADYDVVLEAEYARCDCPAFARAERCKHVAAVAWALVREGPEAPAVPRPPLPDVLRHLYAADVLLERLGLYHGAPVEPDPSARYTPVGAWWRASDLGRPRTVVARAEVLAALPAIEATLAALRQYRPRPGVAAGTELGRVRDALVAAYEEARPTALPRKALPGPLDERHPGFRFRWDPERRRLVVEEPKTALLERTLALGVIVPVDPRRPVTFESGALGDPSGADAWDLFALRALLQALDARVDPVLAGLARELSLPLWERTLEQLAPEPAAPREWGFTLVLAPDGLAFTLEIAARAEGKGRSGAFKKVPLEAIFREGAPAFEQTIARLVLAAREGATRPSFRFGTAAAHEVLRALEHHPRVFLAERGGEPALVTEIIVGALAVRLVRERGGALAPAFFVGKHEVEIPEGRAPGEGGRPLHFDGRVVRTHGAVTVLSIEIPAPLVRWVEMAARLGAGFRFPPEAMTRLVDTTAPLLAAGHVELPKEALGEELAAEPAAALRVAWTVDRDEPSAEVEVLVAVHPEAPLVGRRGPRLFTFELGPERRRVFVERDHDREDERIEALVDGPLGALGLAAKDATTFVARSLEAALALAAWLEENPERLRIEVKIGRPPTLRVAKEGLAEATLAVDRVERWLVFDGALVLGDTKLTLGAMLEAIRQAKRYVRAERGVFVELGEELVAALRPIAIATELVPRGERGERADAGAVDAGLRIREAFAPTLAEVARLFGVVDDKVDLEAYVRRFAGRDKRPKVPRLDSGELRPYQKDGVAWLLGLASWAPGAVLADDMGLGKTIQTAAVLKARAKLGPALVVAPASVSSNWVRELERFVPSLAVSWYNQERRELAAIGPGEVLVVSYNLLAREREAFASQRWTTVVLDEAQYVKNADAERTRSVKKLPRDFTIALTGTPVENDLGELWAIVDLAFPGLLADERTFRETFRRPIEQRNDAERLALLGRLLAPFLLRRTRAAVLTELPPREEITELVDLSEEERRRYLALRKVVEEDLAERRRRRGGLAGMRIELLAALTRLRQLACEVRLLDSEYDGPSTKIDRVVELARQLRGEGNHALVFSQFTSFLALVRDALERAGLRVGYLAGDTSLPERQARIDAFQAGAYDVFCVSLLAGGTGLNLTRASYVVHLDPWWNPAAEEQATARAHRMGQASPVTVYRLVARGTIEEAVLRLHARKRKLASAVLDGRGEAETVTSEELLELLGVS